MPTMSEDSRYEWSEDEFGFGQNVPDASSTHTVMNSAAVPVLESDHHAPRVKQTCRACGILSKLKMQIKQTKLTTFMTGGAVIAPALTGDPWEVNSGAFAVVGCDFMMPHGTTA